MLETINTTSQSVALAGAIQLGSISVSDYANRIKFTDGDTISFELPGKYRVHGEFVLYNSTSSATTETITLYINDASYGLPIVVTVPATGYSEIVIDKVVTVRPSTIGNLANLKFITPSGADVFGCLTNVYKIV